MNGSIEVREVPPGSWPTIATVIGHNLDKSEDTSLRAEEVQEQEEVSEGESPDPGNPPEGYDELGDDVGDETAPESNGGKGPDYDPKGDGTGPKCGWYAEDLRQRLAAMEEGGEAKYDTTFTAIIKLNPDWAPDKPGVEKWDEETGHCLTDIHWPDGTTTWLEAQFPGDDAVDNEDTLDELDGDGDGKIEYSDNPEKTGDEPTDGDVLIEVYESREAAEAAGLTVDGQDND